MTIFSDIKSRIADDLDRTDIGSQIDREARRAVQHYERQRWWFNETLTTLTTSQSLANYAVPSDFLLSDNVELQRSSGNLVRLTEISWDRYLDNWRYSTSSGGQPIDWTYAFDQIWLGPMPNASYNFILSYVKSFLPQSFSDGTQNAWTDFADDLIVARAEKNIAAKLLGMQSNELLVYNALELSAYNALSALNDQKIMTGTPRPWIG